MPDNKGTYSIKEIKNGFERFFQENDHYPTAPEIDGCDYLPSARQIQRNYGGLPKLRKLLGLPDIHFGIGKFRSKIAHSRNKIGFDAERGLEKILIEHFGEPFVHIEKPINTLGRQRFDFFVYAEDLKFGVDVFYSETERDVQKNINIKIDNYRDTIVPIYFVLANNNIPQAALDKIVSSKSKKPLPLNIKLLTLENFMKLIKTMAPHE